MSDSNIRTGPILAFQPRVPFSVSHDPRTRSYSIFPLFNDIFWRCLVNLGGLLLTALNDELTGDRGFSAGALSFSVTAASLEQIAILIPAPLIFLFRRCDRSVRHFQDFVSPKGVYAVGARSLEVDVKVAVDAGDATADDGAKVEAREEGIGVYFL
ncbi:hypothetical protein R3P38DRAFT_2804555 [Favolaschia claudopus]|uniref:Uncharacterized protein n=1 Tax=Favolaschia claudopus TaxID=2862362 RepID=A0AAV9ZQ38_9AGAR